jgi:hypothetical protein
MDIQPGDGSFEEGGFVVIGEEPDWAVIGEEETTRSTKGFCELARSMSLSKPLDSLRAKQAAPVRAVALACDASKRRSL